MTPVTIIVRRPYKETPERVFDAWLDPSAVGAWLFATPDGEMLRVEIDARIGGGFTIVERRGEVDAEHWGEYREIARPHRLVFTFAAVRDVEPTLVTIEIVLTAEGCELTLTHEMDPRWAEDEGRTRDGWTGILAGLARTLEPQVRLSRWFDVPRELVWRAWTEPDRLAHWHAPEGCSIVFASIDVRPGGRFRSTVATPDGKDCRCVGEYLEVVAPERLVYKIALSPEDAAAKDPGWPASTTVTVMLTEENGGTRLVLHQTAPESVARRTGAYGSWLSMLDLLAADLKNLDNQSE